MAVLCKSAALAPSLGCASAKPRSRVHSSSSSGFGVACTVVFAPPKSDVKVAFAVLKLGVLDAGGAGLGDLGVEEACVPGVARPLLMLSALSNPLISDLAVEFVRILSNSGRPIPGTAGLDVPVVFAATMLCVTLAETWAAAPDIHEPRPLIPGAPGIPRPSSTEIFAPRRREEAEMRLSPVSPISSTPLPRILSALPLLSLTGDADRDAAGELWMLPFPLALPARLGLLLRVRCRVWVTKAGRSSVRER